MQSTLMGSSSSQGSKFVGQQTQLLVLALLSIGWFQGGFCLTERMILIKKSA